MIPEVENAQILSSEANMTPSTSQSLQEEQKPAGNAFSKMLRSRSGSEPKPEKLKKATQRLELDDSDTSADASPIAAPTREPPSQVLLRPTMPGGYPDSYISTNGYDASAAAERLSESPVQVSPVDMSHTNPPALMGDSSSQEDHPSPVSSPSPEMIDVDELHEKKGSIDSRSTPTSTSTWSDAHLRTFFDDDADIKDLLVVVYDKSGVVPAGPDHPITGNLFRTENAKLADITNVS
jgi:hypothetical protein